MQTGDSMNNLEILSEISNTKSIIHVIQWRVYWIKQIQIIFYARK